MIDTNILHVDELKMYFGDPYDINDKIKIYQPTLRDIKSFGEKEYYSIVHTLTCIPSDMKSNLFNIGIDYMEISDFKLFTIMSRGLSKEDTKLVLGDIDLSSFVIKPSEQNGELILYDEINDITIDNYVYMKIMEYIRKVHGIKSKVEKAANNTTKKILIELDKQKKEKAKKEPYVSQLRKMISALMRYPGCTMTLEQILDLPLCAFMDLVEGSQVYVSSTALLNGRYCGMIDTSKINVKEFNWMRSLGD